MADVVVSVPKTFTHPAAPGKRGLAAWTGEGDAAGETLITSPEEFAFTISAKPKIKRGERVYVVCEGKLRGYAPLIRVEYYGRRRYGLVRGDGLTAKAVTIPERIAGFRGFRYRWWDRWDEVPFPNWKVP